MRSSCSVYSSWLFLFLRLCRAVLPILSTSWCALNSVFQKECCSSCSVSSSWLFLFLCLCRALLPILSSTSWCVLNISERMLFLLFSLLFLAVPAPVPVPRSSPYIIINKLMRTKYFRENAVPPVLSTLPGCSCSCACAALVSPYYHQQADAH